MENAAEWSGNGNTERLRGVRFTRLKRLTSKRDLGENDCSNSKLFIHLIENKNT